MNLYWRSKLKDKAALSQAIHLIQLNSQCLQDACSKKSNQVSIWSPRQGAEQQAEAGYSRESSRKLVKELSFLSVSLSISVFSRRAFREDQTWHSRLCWHSEDQSPTEPNSDPKTGTKNWQSKGIAKIVKDTNKRCVLSRYALGLKDICLKHHLPCRSAFTGTQSGIEQADVDTWR